MDRRIRYRERIIKFIQDLKASTRCADCRKKYPYYVMEFDHVRGKKEFKISSVSKGDIVGWPKILAEIAKCELVCSNCHKIREHKRGWYR